jgi:hypothetical protein
MSGAVKGGRVSGASVLPLAIAAAALLGSASGHHAFGASHLRLRGGGREMELASAIQRSVDGIITADEAAELSRVRSSATRPALHGARSGQKCNSDCL